MARRRARNIQLLFTGAAVIAVTGCGEQTRYVYANLKDCTAEWQIDECQPRADGSFIAPDSGWDDDDDGGYIPRSGTSTASKAIRTVKRSGFGSLSRSFGSSRS